MSIKHVLLDLDDTLFDFHYSESVSLSRTLSQLDIDPSEENIALYSRINRTCWEALERGEMDREAVLTERFRIFFRALGKDRDPKKARTIYESLLSGCHHMLPGAMELIMGLEGRYTLSIASNGTAAVQDKRLAASGIIPLFDHIFISERMGADKPSSVFFDGCMAALGNPPKEEVIIVGDSLSSDIKGGVAYGIHTCFYNKKGVTDTMGVIPEYQATELSQIPDIISKIR
jgi:2-haloacid dehalogenase